MSPTKPTSRRYTVELVISCVLILIAGLIYINRQFIADYVSVEQYKPNSVIESLVENSGMSSKGEFYFYSAQPALLSSVDFSYHCGTQDASAAVLGCYKDGRIYIYDVENSKLDGIKTVTAAHEMLHVAYRRLDDSEKNRINSLLEDEYKKLKDDESFQERMDFYHKFEPGERDNELHSIVATEVKSISPELEEYYKRYFDDRQKSVSNHDKYIDTFTSLQNKSDKLVKNLNSLAASINARTKDYNKSVAEFNQDVSRLNSQAESGAFSSYAEYESRRQSLMSRSSELSSTSKSINSDIKKYNKQKKQLEKLGDQYAELLKSIDSTIVESPDSVKSGE